MSSIEEAINSVSPRKKVKYIDFDGNEHELSPTTIAGYWKQNERDGGKFCWDYDEPAPGLAKPRTGDAVGKETGGDFESKNFIGEAKYTTKRSRAITKDEWDKIQDRARQNDKMALMRINCQNKFIFWAISESHLSILMEKAKLYDAMDKSIEPRRDRDLEYALTGAVNSLKKLMNILRKKGINVDD